MKFALTDMQRRALAIAGGVLLAFDFVLWPFAARSQSSVAITTSTPVPIPTGAPIAIARSTMPPFAITSSTDKRWGNDFNEHVAQQTPPPKAMPSPGARVGELRPDGPAASAVLVSAGTYHAVIAYGNSSPLVSVGDMVAGHRIVSIAPTAVTLDDGEVIRPQVQAAQTAPTALPSAAALPATSTAVAPTPAANGSTIPQMSVPPRPPIQPAPQGGPGTVQQRAVTPVFPGGTQP